MPQIKLDSRLYGELVKVYKFLTGNDGNDMVDYVDQDLQSGRLASGISLGWRKNFWGQTKPRCKRRLLMCYMTAVLLEICLLKLRIASKRS